MSFRRRLLGGLRGGAGARRAGAFLGLTAAAAATTATYRYRQLTERLEQNLPTRRLSVFGEEESEKKNDSMNKGEEQEAGSEKKRSGTSDSNISSSSSSSSQKQNVLVIGAGVVGVATAYKLAKAGHSVTVLEPNPEPGGVGQECTSCAAGGMQVSNPVVDKDSWLEVLKCVVPVSRFLYRNENRRRRHYNFFNISWTETLSDPFFLRWVVAFTRTSLFPYAYQNDKQMEMLKFTKYAVEDLVRTLEGQEDRQQQQQKNVVEEEDDVDSSGWWWRGRQRRRRGSGGDGQNGKRRKTATPRNDKDGIGAKSGYNPRGSLALSYDDPIDSDRPRPEGTAQEVDADGDGRGASSSTRKMTSKAAAAVVDIARRFSTKAGSGSAGSDDSSATADSAASSSSGDGAGKNPTASKMTYEPSWQLIGSDNVLEVEPSLRYQVDLPTSARYEYQAKAASAERFAKELAVRCATDPKLDVTFLYNTRVQAIDTTTTTTGGNNESTTTPLPATRISRIRTNRGVIDVPAGTKVVCAVGAWMPQLLALMDLYAPVYPLRGYAMSVSAKEALEKKLVPDDTALPSRIVCDKYMFTTRLGDEIRITSVGEFSGWTTAPTPSVDAEFRKEAVRQFPQLKELIEKATTQCGHRPFVNDGILLLGADANVRDLYVSCGPGSNGWKLAMGSGEVIARLISGQTTDQISKDLGFDVDVFSPAGRVLKAPIFAKLCRARWGV